MKRVIILAALLLLGGCELMPAKVQIVEVKVPVAVVPAPPVTPKPKLDVETITIQKNGYDGYVKALESDLIRMKTYTDNLENIIKSYDSLSKKLEAVHTKEDKNVNPK